MKKTCLCLLIVLFSSAAVFGFISEANKSPIEIEKYKMNCLLFDPFGSEATTKLQFSLKAQVIRGFSLYFAYSQSLYWQLWKYSQPMYDINYNPEFFYRFDFSRKEEPGTVCLDIGLIEHESNRVGGDGSRGWNRTYVRFFQTWSPWAEKDMPRFYLNFKLWVPYFLDSTNLDIAKYRGIYEIYFTWADFLKSGFFPESDLTLRIYPGGPWLINPIDGAAELTWRFKTGFFPDTLAMAYLQLFWGHAENLRDYNAPPVFKFRLGVGF